jgi:hypothetical protein
MRQLLAILVVLIALPAFAADSKSDNALVITFKDGHKQTVPVSDVSRIEFRTSGKSTPVEIPAASSSLGTSHFLGRWRVGDGQGNTFIITLDRNGRATKSVGDRRGTWSVVNGEARINWDDGWHDAIRKVGIKYEKVAYGPGKDFSDEPSNVADAKSLEPI